MAFAGVKNHGSKNFLPEYENKKWNVELEKPDTRKISLFKGGGMLDSHLRSKKIVPSPNKYNLTMEMGTDKGHNPVTTKSPRITEPDEIQRS